MAHKLGTERTPLREISVHFAKPARGLTEWGRDTFRQRSAASANASRESRNLLLTGGPLQQHSRGEGDRHSAKATANSRRQPPIREGNRQFAKQIVRSSDSRPRLLRGSTPMGRCRGPGHRSTEMPGGQGIGAGRPVPFSAVKWRSNQAFCFSELGPGPLIITLAIL